MAEKRSLPKRLRKRLAEEMSTKDLYRRRRDRRARTDAGGHRYARRSYEGSESAASGSHLGRGGALGSWPRTAYPSRRPKWRGHVRFLKTVRRRAGRIRTASANSGAPGPRQRRGTRGTHPVAAAVLRAALSTHDLLPRALAPIPARATLRRHWRFRQRGRIVALGGWGVVYVPRYR
jgi:hypothetical protein